MAEECTASRLHILAYIKSGVFTFQNNEEIQLPGADNSQPNIFN